MAKELPGTNASPDVFQMFSRRRFSLDSNVSPLSQLASTTSAPSDRPAVPRLRKSLTQEHLSLSQSLKAFAPASSSISNQVAGDLHIPAARATSPSPQVPIQPPGGGKGSSDVSSVESRNQMEPFYLGSGILKSFRQEVKVFGDLPMPGDLRPLAKPEACELSRVKEEAEEETKNDTQAALVPKMVENKEATSQNTPSDLLISASLPTDSVDGQALKGSDTSFTKQMLRWFVTPHKKSNTSKMEFNAVTPTSF